LVDDSNVYREMQGLLLDHAGYHVSAHESPQTALELAATQYFDLAILDYELPIMNGQQFMHALRKLQPEIPVIFVSGSLTLDLAIQLTREGVAGIFNKPSNPKTLLEKVNEILGRNSTRDTAASIGSGHPLSGRRGGAPYAGSTDPAADQLAFKPKLLLGSSPVLLEFTHRMWKVRDFRSVLLLQGEPGSPFESLARDVVDISVFRDGPVMVCGANEFEARRLIEVLAPFLLSHDAGTLIVSGVELFTPEQQVVLNDLMSGRDVFLPFARRFRLVLAATGRLWDRVERGAFDETLYYKIASLSLTVPKLREMSSDIPEIAREILAGHGVGEEGLRTLDFTAEAADWLEARPWPKNYDQLRATVLKAIPHARNGRISIAALQSALPKEEVPNGAVLETPVHHEPLTADHFRDTTQPSLPISSRHGVVASAKAPSANSPVVAARADPPAPAPAPVLAARRANGAAAARASARTLFSKPTAAPVRPVASKSLYRPASAKYQFTARLEVCLALAERSAGG
jgi:DNA-binding NtrC family response regulator